MEKIFYPSINSLIREGDIEALTEALNALSPFELTDLTVKKSDRN
ncbi:hypothetical protein PNK_2393 [Candidatus Protochlamydia naegleriophila]|uniref:Uncharacterized protein n=1 Tax=Candidatus Protochlamydia naegleriophila TaxID=389348 RepID=A0A0U5JJ35_9BACT|nr:hypothetical protein PNK_2393 [Candidatus Protochlamydia naegleriophila]